MDKLEQLLDSREVAEMMSKNHADLIRDIRRYGTQLAESNIALGDFFQESTYTDSNNQERPCYKLSKKGCEFVAHKLTGVKGTEFTAKYINRFHEMEETINQPKTPMQLLQLEFEAIKEVDEKVDAVNEDLQKFKEDMPILPVEASLITNAVKRVGVRCMGGKNSNSYKDKSIVGTVYRDIYNQLYREFGVSTYRVIKRNQCDLAIGIIEAYTLPFALKERIECCNAQMNMEVA